ncbi:MAG: TolC family protein, partial [Myxococcota bacterium]
LARATADLVSAWYDADAARAKLVALDSVALPAASSAAELAATAYTAGEIDLPAVLASRQELADVRVERVQALIDAVNARAALARAAGGDPHAPLF